jgi:acetyltransferase-like isoleucine patch superfamily enzyme/acyl carrier protein
MSMIRALKERSQRGRFRRSCTSVGNELRLAGAPTVFTFNGTGRIHIGDRFSLASQPVPSHLVAYGTLRIGDDVAIGYGAAVAAIVSVTVGDRTRIGPFFVVMDTDFHGERVKRGARPTTHTAPNEHSGYASVVIGRDVQIGPHVTVLRGSVIGDGAIVGAGSVVNGHVRVGATVTGVPARVSSGGPSEPGSDGADVGSIVARVFGLAETPDLHSGPEDIPEWDSLGSLKLLLALEDSLGIALDEHVVARASTIAELQASVDAVVTTTGVR